jgi:hypothetical protein
MVWQHQCGDRPRRVAFLFNVGWVVLDGTAYSYCEAGAPSIDAGRICRPDESRRGVPKRVSLRYSDRHRIRALEPETASGGEGR